MRALFSWTIVCCTLVAAGILSMPSSRTSAETALPQAKEGCLSHWMFNGIWRVRITKVEPLTDSGGAQIGWLVTEVWRNGTDQKLEPTGTFAKDQQLVLANGAIINAADTTNGTLSSQDLLYHDFPPSAQYTHMQKFIASASFDVSNKPAAVIMTFDASRQTLHGAEPQYSIKPPNYRIKLDCTASAQEQAKGGSFELAAKEGCLNQWLANGLWKMRATTLSPEIIDGQQVGWQVAQDWTNVSGRKMSPGGASLEDEQLVLQNGDTVSSANVTITTLQAQKLFYHDTAPAATFSHVQNFRYFRPAFDPTNKPTKLLVAFNVKNYTYYSGKPFPSNPPNFRISFDCQR